jgi:hypothetical protein
VKLTLHYFVAGTRKRRADDRDHVRMPRGEIPSPTNRWLVRNTETHTRLSLYSRSSTNASSPGLYLLAKRVRFGGSGRDGELNEQSPSTPKLHPSVTPICSSRDSDQAITGKSGVAVLRIRCQDSVPRQRDKNSTHPLSHLAMVLTTRMFFYLLLVC